ncbi:MAG: hypothetical protein HOF02_06405 [Gammaproteobacteria bacterium]|jgi:hypothetical protein|nr:hypothetical protein [Gammaproteobacteria bacterium]
MFFRRAKLLNQIYPIIKEHVSNAGITENSSFTKKINKELQDSGDNTKFLMSEILYDLIVEGTWANRNVIWKQRKYDAEHGALFSIADYLRNVSLSPRGMQGIKDEQPDMYEAMQKLWSNIVVKEITDSNNLGKYDDLILEFIPLKLFDRND